MLLKTPVKGRNVFTAIMFTGINMFISFNGRYVTCVIVLISVTSINGYAYSITKLRGYAANTNVSLPMIV